MKTVIAYNYLGNIDKDEVISLEEELYNKSRYIDEAIDIIYKAYELYSVALNKNNIDNKNDIDESALIIIREYTRSILNYFINKHNKDNNMESYICIDEIIPVLITSTKVYPYADNEDYDKDLMKTVVSDYIRSNISDDRDYLANLTNGEKDVIIIVVLDACIKHHPIAIFSNDDGENEE